MAAEEQAPAAAAVAARPATAPLRSQAIAIVAPTEAMATLALGGQGGGQGGQGGEAAAPGKDWTGNAAHGQAGANPYPSPNPNP